jgi:hypothetical protein
MYSKKISRLDERVERKFEKTKGMWARKRAEGLGFLFFRERVMVILQRRWFSFRSLSLVRSFYKTTTHARCLCYFSSRRLSRFRRRSFFLSLTL